MKRIKIAQIGTGHDHASNIFSTIVNLPELFEVVGYVKLEGEEKLFNERRPAYGDFKQLTLDEVFSIPDLDAVTVETFDLQLVQYAQMAANHGLHVFMDKPGNESAEEFEKMLSTLKNKGKIFSIGYMYRFNPAVIETLETVKTGKLGEIYAVEAHMSCDHPDEKRQWLEAFEGGMTFYLGCHLVDLIYTLMGIPEEIIPYNVNTGIHGVTSKEYGFVLFRYKNGISFLKTACGEVGGFERRQLVVCGSQGTVEIKPLEWYTGSVLHAGVRTALRENPQEFLNWNKKGDYKQSESCDRYEAMLKDFAAKVEKGNMAEEEYLREARVHRLVLAASGIDCNYKAEIQL